jgi:hypothetical protein
MRNHYSNEKEYVKPTSAVYEVEMQQVIAASVTVNTTKNASSDYEAESEERASWGSLW